MTDDKYTKIVVGGPPGDGEPTGYAGSSGIALSEIDFVLKLTPQNSKILEIGTYHGVTAALITDRRPDVSVMSVDPFPTEWNKVYNCSGKGELWLNNRRGNMTLLIGTMNDLKKLGVREVFDVIIVDGNHLYEYVLEDLRQSDVVLKRDGFLLVHDYGRSGQDQIMRAVRDFLGEANYRMEDRYWSMLLLKQGRVKSPDNMVLGGMRHG